MKSRMFSFLLCMWVMGRIDEPYLDRMVEKGRITHKEEEMILATPQVPSKPEV